MKNICILLCALSSSLLLTACSENSSNTNTSNDNLLDDPRLKQQGQYVDDYQYKVPEVVDGDWQVAHIDDVGIDHDLIDKLVQKTLDGDYKALHSILIIKDEKLVLEEYFDGIQYAGGTAVRQYHRDTLHPINSVTKSFASAIVGIAIDQGLIYSVDEKLSTFFPESTSLQQDGKGEITLEHVLTMSSGLAWDAGLGNLVKLELINDWQEYIFSKELTHAPGELFHYSNSMSQILGDVVARQSGMQAYDYLQEHLFSAVDIDQHGWYPYLSEGPTNMAAGLYLRPRDMAKFGQLFLNEGSWDGQQVISSSWVDVSTTSHIGEGYYGYQWWLKSFSIGSQAIDSYFAWGFGGQYIWVFPALNVVVVFTAGNFNEDQDPVNIAESMLADFILPAVLP